MQAFKEIYSELQQCNQVQGNDIIAVKIAEMEDNEHTVAKCSARLLVNDTVVDS
jgi:hypothetical protein